MTDNTTKFEQRLRAQTKVKNIPNARFESGQFQFGDYFDPDAYGEAFVGDGWDVEEIVDLAFSPFETYLVGVDEIDVERHYSDMYWCDVTVTIPDNEDHQRLLADLVADAWQRRQER